LFSIQVSTWRNTNNFSWTFVVFGKNIFGLEIILECLPKRSHITGHSRWPAPLTQKKGEIDIKRRVAVAGMSCGRRYVAN